MGIFYTWAKTTQNSYSGFLWWLYRIIYDINVFWTNWLSLGRNSLKLRDKVVPLMFVTSKAFSPAIELNEPTIPLLVIGNARIIIASGQLSQENHKVQGLCPRERERKWIKQLSCRLVPFFTPHFSHSFCLRVAPTPYHKVSTLLKRLLIHSYIHLIWRKVVNWKL